MTRPDSERERDELRRRVSALEARLLSAAARISQLEERGPTRSRGMLSRPGVRWSPFSPGLRASAPPRSRDIVKSGFRRLATLHHPDRGAQPDGRVIQELQVAKEWLLEQIGSA